MNRQVSIVPATLRRVWRKVALSAGLGLAVASGAMAQSFRDFSQFHLTPTLVNPTNAGLENDLRVLYGQRQMSIGANSFISHTASLTYPFFGERAGQKVRTSHVGLTYVADRTGVGGLLNVNGILGSYSYNLSINEKHRLGLGLQLGFYNRAINTNSLQTGAQFSSTTGSYDPSRDYKEPDLNNGSNSVWYPVVNGGATWFSEDNHQVRHHLGVAWQNINQPLYSFDRSPKANLPAIFVFDGGINVLPVENRFVFEPNFRAIYLNGSNNLVNLGALVKYKLSESDPGYGHVGVGGWYSVGNAAIFSLEVALPYFFAGYSYDATTSSLGSSIAKASTNELIVGFRMNRADFSVKPDVAPPAPIPAPVKRPVDTVKPAPKPVVTPQPVKPAQPEVETPIKEPVKPVVKPSKPTKPRKYRGGSKGKKGGKRNTNLKYAIDKNNKALAAKYGLTQQELEILNNKPMFELNNWDLSKDGQQQLDDVAAVMENHPDLKIEVGGHTCTIGTDAQNEIVGNRRSESGYDYLVSKGIDPSRLSKFNYTTTLPIADNSTSAGRVKNRRISFKIKD